MSASSEAPLPALPQTAGRHGGRSIPGALPALPRPDFRHMPVVDGLRGCAILLVLVAHFGFSQLVPGGFGVTLFFFISGFLITRLLMAEHAESGGISVGKFYVRRMLRLYPALVVTVAASYATYAWLSGRVLWNDIAAALLYASNYYNIFVRFGSGYDADVSHLVHIGVLWSLAVEEQYYLLFPLLFAPLAGRGQRFLQVVLVLAVACLLWRIALASNGAGSGRIYAGTDTRLDSILYGAVLTALLAGPNALSWQRVLTHPLSVVAGIGVLLLTFVHRDTFFRDTFRYTLQGIALMPIVASLCFGNRLQWAGALLRSKPIQLLGAWSYSLYLFHQLALTFAEKATGESYMNGFRGLSLQWYLIALPATFAMACGSYYFVERPFLALRHRFGSRSS